MTEHRPAFRLTLAQTDAEIRAAQRLRYDVFVAELGADGEMVDHENRLEVDRFDAHFDHLLLLDEARGADVMAQVVGVYRVLRDDQMPLIGQYYTEDEYDVSALKSSGRKLLELGRSCVAAPYRGGAALFHLWQGLGAYVSDHNIEILFGSASFHGTDIDALAQPLSFLHHRHLAPPELRVSSLPHHFQTMNLMPEDQIDRMAASKALPPLIKAYLRVGGYVGEGAYVDHAFNTTDVCLVMDTNRMSARQKSIYAGQS